MTQTFAIRHTIELQYKLKIIGFTHKMFLQNIFSYHQNIYCIQMNITFMIHFYGLRNKKVTSSLKKCDNPSVILHPSPFFYTRFFYPIYCFLLLSLSCPFCLSYTCLLFCHPRPEQRNLQLELLARTNCQQNDKTN